MRFCIEECLEGSGFPVVLRWSPGADTWQKGIKSSLGFNNRSYFCTNDLKLLTEKPIWYSARMRNTREREGDLGFFLC